MKNQHVDWPGIGAGVTPPGQQRKKSSLAKLRANRRNAGLSTGPATAASKAKASAHAIKSGCYSSLPVIPGENPAEWKKHLAGIIASVSAQGFLERILAERIALLLWRLQRLSRYETLCLVEKCGKPELDYLDHGAGSVFDELSMKARPGQARSLVTSVETEERIHRAESHLNRLLFRTINQLQLLQANRQGRPVNYSVINLGVSQLSRNGAGSAGGNLLEDRSNGKAR